MYRLLSSMAKAADKDANLAGPDRIGLLGRLKVRLGRLAGIGNEVDRLGGDEDANQRAGLSLLGSANIFCASASTSG
jgi:hypothetical protein